MLLYVRCCSIVAALTTVTYDYILTFRDEVDLVWNRPITLGSALFALNRYLPFVDLSLSLQLYLGSPRPNSKACRDLELLTAGSILLSVFCSETMLILRTIAIWNCRRSLTIGLCALHMMVISSTLSVAMYYWVTFRFEAIPGSEPCLILNFRDVVIYAQLIPFFILDTTVFALMVIKAYYHLQNGVSSWVHHMYRGGFICFALTFIFSLLNFFIPLFAPPHLRLICIDFHRISHSIICNRLFFMLLRQQETLKIRDSKVQQAKSFYTLTVDDFTTPNDFGFQDQLFNEEGEDLESRLDGVGRR
ncbi:hypothetical protein CPB83DRAFT_596758 [Crepidotus variabilis]|uniref:DUF6533 domain-containing protein n=1 Tax=Crepidotus variabilis TaxID=179855 RepID=A0A9P6JLK1_9AGAR|nr:hypothetical protein CPB83DRAFT_596758 [Crepidotus variabilis]